SRTVRSFFFPSPSIPCATVTLHHRAWLGAFRGRIGTAPAEHGFAGAAAFLCCIIIPYSCIISRPVLLGYRRFCSRWRGTKREARLAQGRPGLLGWAGHIGDYPVAQGNLRLPSRGHGGRRGPGGRTGRNRRKGPAKRRLPSLRRGCAPGTGGAAHISSPAGRRRV